MMSIGGRIMTADAQALAKALARVERLDQEIGALRATVAELERRVAELIAENRALQGHLDESRRQAAPFRRRDSQKVPEARRKRLGRPKGHPGVHRSIPAQVDEHIEVPLPARIAAGPSRRSSRSSSSSRRSRRSGPGSPT
jgi:hypothetical protein